jgi:hypothetical protein
MSRTAALADKMSAKVRVLDQEQLAVKQALKHVSDAQHLKDAIVGVQKAMQGKVYDAAAKCIQDYLSFDPQSLQMLLNDSLLSLEDAETTTVADAAKIMTAATEELEAVCCREFDKAVTDKDADRTLRYWKLFAQMGRHSAGMDKLCRYLSHDIIRAALPNDDPSGLLF